MPKTINRAYLRRLIERGQVELISSYHFDDMTGESRFEGSPVPVFIGEYGQSKPDHCMLFASDLTSSSGSATVGENGNIHLRVHSNCSYDFRLKNGGVVTPQTAPSFEVSSEHRQKIQDFADKVDVQTMLRLVHQGYGSQVDSNRVKVTFGKKYTRIDVGDSGRYMVDRNGDIYGIKAYGVIHRGHHYGTLDTINEWNWGNYSAHKQAAEPHSTSRAETVKDR